MKHVTVSDRFSVRDIIGDIHDARFRKTDILFDQGSHTWTLVCWGPRRRHGSIRNEWWQELRLIVSNVTAYTLSFTENPPYFEVASLVVSEDEKQLEVVCQYAASLKLTVSELNVQLRQDDNAFKRKWDE